MLDVYDQSMQTFTDCNILKATSDLQVGERIVYINIAHPGTEKTSNSLYTLSNGNIMK